MGNKRNFRNNVRRLNGERRRIEQELSRLLMTENLSGFEKMRHEAIAFSAEHKALVGQPTLSGEIARPRDSKRNLKLNGLNLSGLELGSLKFYGVDLDDAVIRDAVISDSVRFISCGLSRITFERVVEHDFELRKGLIIFMHSRVVDGHFKDMKLVKGGTGLMDESAGLNFRRRTNFRGCTFENLELQRLQLCGFGLDTCSFQESCAFERVQCWYSLEELYQETLDAVERSGLKKLVSDEWWNNHLEMLEKAESFRARIAEAKAQRKNS